MYCWGLSKRARQKRAVEGLVQKELFVKKELFGIVRKELSFWDKRTRAHLEGEGGGVREREALRREDEPLRLREHCDRLALVPAWCVLNFRLR